MSVIGQLKLYCDLELLGSMELVVPITTGVVADVITCCEIGFITKDCRSSF
jgi:hypothetical protein